MKSETFYTIFVGGDMGQKRGYRHPDLSLPNPEMENNEKCNFVVFVRDPICI